MTVSHAHVTHADQEQDLVLRHRNTSSMARYLVHDLRPPPSAYGALFTVNTGLVIALEVPLSAYTHSAMMSIAMMTAPSVGTAVLRHLGGRTLWTRAWAIGAISAILLTRLPEIGVGHPGDAVA